MKFRDGPGGGAGHILYRTSSPSRKVSFKLSATCFAMVDLPHAVAPVKKKTYRGFSSVGFSPIV